MPASIQTLSIRITEKRQRFYHVECNTMNTRTNLVPVFQSLCNYDNGFETISWILDKKCIIWNNFLDKNKIFHSNSYFQKRKMYKKM